MANSVTFPSSIGGDDNTYTDDNNPDTGLAGGGAVVRLIPMFSNVVNIANYVITVGSNAVNAPATNATSTTSLTIGTGSKSLTLAEIGKLFYIGQTVSISDTTGLNVMSGTITAFDSGTGAMTVNVTNAIGTGTIASWIISVGALSATSTGTSLVKGNGTGGFSAATVRTDYAEPTTALATGLLKNTTTTGAHTIAVAGTDYQAVITGGATTITTADLTVSRALASNASGKVVVSTVTSTELGYLSGVTSAIQTQLGTKQATLVSATNIKTVNGNTLLGSGNLAITTSGLNSGATTNMTGLLKGDGTTISATTDYATLGANTFTADQTIGWARVGHGSNFNSTNTVLGYDVLNGVSNTGTYNTAVGYMAGNGVTSGNYNTFLGARAGVSNTTGAGNIIISPMTSGSSVSPVFSVTTQNDRISMGSTGITNAYVQVAWTVVSDARDKTNFSPVPHGLDFVNQLKPISYQFRESRDSDITNGGVKYGFKAQDILELEGQNSVIIDSQNPEKLYYTSDHLIPVLVKAIQELTARVVELENR
jgi:hypothetical protein